MTKPLKTKEERLGETVHILKQLIDLGIHKEDPGYKEVKSKFDEWILTGDSWNGSVHLIRYGRRADINLPRRNGSAASLNLKVL